MSSLLNDERIKSSSRRSSTTTQGAPGRTGRRGDSFDAGQAQRHRRRIVKHARTKALTCGDGANGGVRKYGADYHAAPGSHAIT